MLRMPNEIMDVTKTGKRERGMGVWECMLLLVTTFYHFIRVFRTLLILG